MSYPYTSLHLEIQRARKQLGSVFQPAPDLGTDLLTSSAAASALSANCQKETAMLGSIGVPAGSVGPIDRYQSVLCLSGKHSRPVARAFAGLRGGVPGPAARNAPFHEEVFR